MTENAQSLMMRMKRLGVRVDTVRVRAGDVETQGEGGGLRLLESARRRRRNVSERERCVKRLEARAFVGEVEG